MKSGSKTGKDPGEDGTRRWYQQVQTAGGKESARASIEDVGCGGLVKYINSILD